MARRQQGFVFSLDAFVAFSLILIAIQSMVIVSSTPSGYWPSLLQADFLAKDTLRAAANTQLSSGGSVLSASSARISSNSLSSGDDLILLSDQLIRPPYSYTYSYYDLGAQKWAVVYNASDPAYVGASDPRINLTFRRVAASSERLLMEYSTQPVRPESPWCNVMCHGWGGSLPGNYQSPDTCVQTPCSPQPASAYETGNLTFGLLRLTVWG